MRLHVLILSLGHMTIGYYVYYREIAKTQGEFLWPITRPIMA